MVWLSTLNTDAVKELKANPGKHKGVDIQKPKIVFELFINGGTATGQPDLTIKSDQHPNRTSFICEFMRKLTKNTPSVVHGTAGVWHGKLAARFKETPNTSGCPPEDNPPDTFVLFSIICPLIFFDHRQKGTPKCDLDYCQMGDVDHTSWVKFISQPPEGEVEWKFELFVWDTADLPPRPSNFIVTHSVPKQAAMYAATEETVVCTLETFIGRIITFAVPTDEASHYKVWKDRNIPSVAVLTMEWIIGAGGFFHVQRMQDVDACQDGVMFMPGGGMLLQTPVGWGGDRLGKFQDAVALFRGLVCKQHSYQNFAWRGNGELMNMEEEGGSSEARTIFDVCDAVFEDGQNSAAMNFFIKRILECAAELQDSLLKFLCHTVCHEEASKSWYTRNEEIRTRVLPDATPQQRQEIEYKRLQEKAEAVEAAKRNEQVLLARVADCETALKAHVGGDKDRNQQWLQISLRITDRDRDDTFHSVHDAAASVKRMRFTTSDENTAKFLITQAMLLLTNSNVTRDGNSWIHNAFRGKQ